MLGVETMDVVGPPRMSSEIAEDAITSLGDKMTQEIALAFAVKEDTVGFTGTGISTDGGMRRDVSRRTIASSATGGGFW